MRPIVFALAALAAWGVAPAHAELRDVADFTRVEASGVYQVEVTHGLGFAVDVSGPEANLITTQREGGTLHIRSTSRHWWGGQRAVNAVVQVTMPGVEALTATRGARMTARDVNAGELALDASAGSSIAIQGICEQLHVSASMGAALNAENLTCATAKVDASMGANVDVRARDAVEAEASMGANVRIAGAPARQSTSATMGGNIRIE